jgi:lipopolysaccharide/colanic/teichoic acid biosynthesis glycosyltransferase
MQRDRPTGSHPAVTSIAKRTVDVLFSSVVLVLLAPLLALIAAAIKATSRGPAIFRQERVGWRGREFQLYKFRTMETDNDDTAHREITARVLRDPNAGANTDDGIFKLENDPRITLLGRWLRRLSLDEIPQMANVLRGDMSIVGPRPSLTREVALFRESHLRRLEVRPGITGLWQVSGRNRLSMLEMLDLDVRYVDTWSFGVDLRIIARTPLVLIRGDGAR